MIQLEIDPNYTNQSILITLEVKEIAKYVRFDIVYHENTKKWYLSLYDMTEEFYYCTNIPLVASYGYVNDLFAPYAYKDIGMLVCVPAVDNPSTPDPSEGNLKEFNLVWGEEIA